MPPTTSLSNEPARAPRRAQQASPNAAPPGGEEDAPSTVQEAAHKFEKVLVRQFTKVMTENMFSSSLAGEGGGKWMESQRDRQREHMTDMITEQLVESNSLGISKKLMQTWNATGGDDAGGGDDAAGGNPESERSSPGAPAGPSDLPADPSELPSRPTGPLPTTPNESHIDHAA